MTFYAAQRPLIGIVLLGAILMPPATAAGPAKLRVTVTVPPLVWLVSQVGGPDVVVEDLVKAGESAETFQPTDRQITGVARSALFFRIGVEAENGPWLKALEDSRTLGIVDLRHGLTLRAMEYGEHGGHEGHRGHGGAASGHLHHEAMDPHTWLSPRCLITMAHTIARHLAEVDPAGAAGYEARALDVVAALEELDHELRLLLAPVAGRAFFVFHPAWGYFADDYGLRQVAIEIEGKEPSERELTELMRQARALNMRTLFVEPTVQSATPKHLARAVGARVEHLDPLAPDLPDNLRRVAGRVLAAMGPVEEAP